MTYAARVLAAVRAARLAEGPLTTERAWAVADEARGAEGAAPR